MSEPKLFRSIMVSGTFSDLREHRQKVIDAILKLGYKPEVMEYSGAQSDTDLIETSLKMVRDASAMISVISHRYGEIPECSKRNADQLSISELEFNEANREGRPTLLFIMGDDHSVKPADVETDPEKRKKLKAFRERAKAKEKGSKVHRIYEVFNSPEEFATNAAIAIGKLAQKLPPIVEVDDQDQPSEAKVDSLATNTAPNLRALPRYLGSHRFVGRKSELETLDDWSAAADPNPMLLFEAIGGTGKSMVTWHWLNEHAPHIRKDWAGRFWYSFYEGGATMRDFCQQALAYMTGKPVKEFRKLTTRALMPNLLAQLEDKPWLMVLDGLERILVAYHRIDAPQLRDEDVDTATDQISNRDPRAAINPEDEELLRKLAAPSKSKVLVSSRLTPQALFNNAQMPIPGVRREPLHGLRPEDAEGLFNACGVTGDSDTIRAYLQENCDCHPLVIGALAGLINSNMKHRGDFDAWLADPEAGGKLGLADLDLTQSRNHILDAAIDALSGADRRLLQTLSLLNGGADYEMLSAFNPHMPTKPTEPTDPEDDFVAWIGKSDDQKTLAKTEYEQALKKHETDLAEWQASPDVAEAPTLFDETLERLEARGLLQFEARTYDLHPVVRGVASGRLGDTETKNLGEGVVDYLSNKPHTPWEDATSLQDLKPGIDLVQTLTRIGDHDRAFYAFLVDLEQALIFNLMAFWQVQQLLRPFFPNGWDGGIAVEAAHQQSRLLGDAGLVFYRMRDYCTSLRVQKRGLRISIDEQDTKNARTALANLAVTLNETGATATSHRLFEIAHELAIAVADEEHVFVSLSKLYTSAAQRGDHKEADRLYSLLDPMGREWSRQLYRPGELERNREEDMFQRGHLTEAQLANATDLCRNGKSRLTLCGCLKLRGDWQLSLKEPAQAIGPLTKALRLYRESGNDDPVTEALLALAKLRAGADNDARDVADRYDGVERHTTALVVAEIWQELGETERAVKAALRAHKSACGSGEPYVFRYYLDRATKLLEDLGQIPPPVPQHDPSQDEVFEWEDDLRALIEKTRQEREERERKEQEN